MAKIRYICTDCGRVTCGEKNLIGGCCPICGGETVWYICAEHTWWPSKMPEGEKGNDEVLNNEYDEQRSKEDKARELANICTRIILKPTTIGMWAANDLYWRLAAMGYEWNGESWQKSS